MIVQAEGFMKAAITLIPEVPKQVEIRAGVIRNTSEELRQFLLNFASFALLFPGHHKHGPFYLIKGLINALQKYEPWQGPNEDKCTVYIGLLNLFCAYAQSEFLYHVPRVESNDRLYGSNSEYMAQLNQFIESLLGGVVSQINEIGAPGDIVSRRKQSQLALQTAQVLLQGVKMNAASATLVVRLVQLARNNRATDRKSVSFHSTLLCCPCLDEWIVLCADSCVCFAIIITILIFFFVLVVSCGMSCSPSNSGRVNGTETSSRRFENLPMPAHLLPVDSFWYNKPAISSRSYVLNK